MLPKGRRPINRREFHQGSSPDIADPENERTSLCPASANERVEDAAQIALPLGQSKDLWIICEVTLHDPDNRRRGDLVLSVTGLSAIEDCLATGSRNCDPIIARLL